MKSNKKIVINGTGCALADFLYNGVSFESAGFRKYLSQRPGDGGLDPGKLVFTEELEQYAGRSYKGILADIIGDKKADTFNVGGPSLVSLIHASQLLDGNEYEVNFYGMAGNDKTASEIFGILKQTPLITRNYLTSGKKPTPFTDVLSDPSYDNGHGERTFVNNIGAAWEYTPEMPGKDFLRGDITCFGGTALVPNIHDSLTELLSGAKRNKSITVVNTVFDFRNEKRNPGEPWPLGNSAESYRLTDILIMDREEAQKISGRKTIEDAASFFISSGTGAFIITNGANPVHIWSSGKLFKKQDHIQMPVSSRVTNLLRSNPEMKGDTTGCGDNFVGGILVSLAGQLKDQSEPDLAEATSWGIASGGFCCFYVGGTYLEKSKGEKMAKVRDLQMDYFRNFNSNGKH